MIIAQAYRVGQVIAPHERFGNIEFEVMLDKLHAKYKNVILMCIRGNTRFTRNGHVLAIRDGSDLGAERNVTTILSLQHIDIDFLPINLFQGLGFTPGLSSLYTIESDDTRYELYHNIKLETRTIFICNIAAQIDLDPINSTNINGWVEFLFDCF